MGWGGDVVCRRLTETYFRARSPGHQWPRGCVCIRGGRGDIFYPVVSNSLGCFFFFSSSSSLNLRAYAAVGSVYGERKLGLCEGGVGVECRLTSWVYIYVYIYM